MNTTPSRAPKRVTKRDEQRDTTRARIMEAALSEFLASSYAETAVDAIAKRAGASRATYYRYFDSKLAVAQAIFEEELPNALSMWKRFSEFRDPTVADIAAWLDEFVAMLEHKRGLMSLFREFQAIEVKSIPQQWGPRSRIIEVLASMPGFRRAHAEEGDGAAHVRAHLLLLTLWEFVYLVAVRGWHGGRSKGIQILAEQFHRFIATDGGASG
jgi:AcrR family transcriptional regulator